MRTWAIAAIIVIAVGASASAEDFLPRHDLEVIAVDARTGAVRWTRDVGRLSNAHFELYPGVLVVYPHYDLRDKSSAKFLDAATGQLVRARRAGAKRIKASSGQWRGQPPIVLANGWRLDFRSGNTKDLAFVDPKRRAVAWTIPQTRYPEIVLAHGDLVLVTHGYLTDEAILFAHRAGSSSAAWTVDFNVLLGKPTAKKALDRLGRVQIQVVDDTLYAQTGEHVFAIEPGTGKILWRVDLASALGVPYRPGLYGGALDMAVFSRDGDVVVAALENRVVALRASTGDILWSMPPDTFPYTAFPLASGGVVYLTSGRGRSVATMPAARPPSP